jgi:hypothetical protein
VPEYVCVKYLNSTGHPLVGSGYLVRDGVVLTANHVADGTGHEVWCDGVKYDVDPAGTVLSGRNDVDLAILRLATCPAQTPSLSYGRVRRDPGIIHDCIAVGYPLWAVSTQLRQYSTKQVEGFIRTADQVPTDGNAGNQLLRLTIKWQPSDPLVEVPEGLLDQQDDSLWSGMSGAVVTCRDNTFVIGVVHSHNYTSDRNSLTLTPLLALRELHEDKQRAFREALDITDIEHLPEVNGRGQSGSPAAAVMQAARPGGPDPVADAFSDGLRDKCRRDLARLAVPAPQRWDYISLLQLHRDCEQRITAQGPVPELLEARNLAKALWLTVAALPMLDRFGGQAIGTKKLRHLYHRHVQAPSDSGTLDGMLFLAAGVGIREELIAAVDGGQPGDEVVTALGRFMLGIACHWKARQEPAESVDLGDMASWVAKHLKLRRVDIEDFIRGMRRRTWALVDLECTENKGDWPTAVVVQTVSDTEDVKTTTSPAKMKRPPQRLPCQAKSVEEVEELLRDALCTLPEGKVLVDLFLPRPWLEERLAYRDLVQVSDNTYESLSSDYKPHLRWRLHHQRRKLAERLLDRFSEVRWMDGPEDISPEITGDGQLLKDWIAQRSGKQDPPYFIAGSDGSGKGGDPLGTLLMAGYGFFVWFAGEVSKEVRQVAKEAAAAAPTGWNRRDKLPLELAARLHKHEPMIIWSDPTGRADFDLPQHSPWGTQGSVTT